MSERTNVLMAGLLASAFAVGILTAVSLVQDLPAAAQVYPTTPTPTPSHIALTPTPTPTPTLFVVTNDTGEPAGFLHLQSLPSFIALPSVSPPGCGTPTVASGFESWEVTWPSQCVDPGESVAFDLPEFVNVFSHYWAASPPVISAVNDTGLLADGLTITAAVFIKGATIIENAPGCPPPTFGFATFGQLDISWSTACVDPSEKVSVHLVALSPVTSAPFVWTTVVVDATPTVTSTPEPPTPTRAIKLPIAGRSAGQADSQTGGNHGINVAALAALISSAIALGAAAWYARRRWAR